MGIERKETAELPTEYGNFKAYVYECSKGLHHIALVKGKINSAKDIIVRVHSECLTGDVFHSKRCDCQQQLDKALRIIGKGSGVLLYLRQEGRGIGLLNKIRAYALQDKGLELEARAGTSASRLHYFARFVKPLARLPRFLKAFKFYERPDR